jgi:hypothetical protein
MSIAIKAGILQRQSENRYSVVKPGQAVPVWRRNIGGGVANVVSPAGMWLVALVERPRPRPYREPDAWEDNGRKPVWYDWSPGMVEHVWLHASMCRLKYGESPSAVRMTQLPVTEEEAAQLSAEIGNNGRLSLFVPGKVARHGEAARQLLDYEDVTASRIVTPDEFDLIKNQLAPGLKNTDLKVFDTVRLMEIPHTNWGELSGRFVEQAISVMVKCLGEPDLDPALVEANALACRSLGMSYMPKAMPWQARWMPMLPHTVYAGVRVTAQRPGAGRKERQLLVSNGELSLFA